MFYAINKEGLSIVLDLLVLIDKRIKMDIADRIWRFGVDEHAHELLHSNKFTSSLKGQKTIYTLIISATGNSSSRLILDTTDTDSLRIKGVASEPKLPE